jgi:hypothetical protein
MRTTVALIVGIMSILPVLQLWAPVSAVENISYDIYWFGNGKQAMLINFDSPGTDESADLSVQTGMYIDQAALNISTVARPAGSQDYPYNLTVDFGADQKPEYQFRGSGYGQFGRQTYFKNGKDLVNLTLSPGRSDNSLSIRLPKTADIRSASMNISVGSRVGTPGKILIIYATGYTDCINNAQSALRAFNNDFSVVDTWDARASTPTLDNLKQYYSVLVWNHGYNGYTFSDQNTLGNNLADYVDLGGGVVCMPYLFAGGWRGNIAGRFTTDNYYVIPWNNNGMSGTSSLTMNKVAAQVNHPVFTNVSSITLSNIMWTVSASPNQNEILATWSSLSATAVAAKSVNGVDRVDIQLMPYSSAASAPTYSQGYTGDGDDLIKNSLLFSGRKPFTGVIDILNDTVEDFNRTNFQGNYTFPDLAGQIQGYLDSANVSYTDPYGNAFVDVPINVTAAMPAMVRFDNLEVLYDYSTSVDRNPSSGDLVSALGDLQSSKIGTENGTIPIKIASDSAGQLKLYDIHLKVSPPVHKPTINSFFPAASSVVKENSKVDFGIDVVDWYGNPMTMQWYRDGAEVAGETGLTFSTAFDFDSAGNHTIKVAVKNGLSTVEQVWTLKVLDVNRPPSLVEFSPSADPSIDENQTQVFRVNATDPDRDALSYKWMQDGKVRTEATTSSFLFTTDFTSAGDHTVKVVVSDPGGLWVGRNWTVHVANVNLPPAITAWSPKSNPRILERETAQFSVTPYDPDGQLTVTTWFVDDVQAFVGNPFVFQTDYKSAGVHTIKAVVSDGKATAARSWEVTVGNVNRIPVAVIDAPTDAEFMQGAAIHFSAQSSYDPDNEELAFSWKEGNVNVSAQVQFDRAFPPGLHTVTLEVRDRSGGVSTASVRFRVRYVELSVLVGMDRLEIVAGDKTSIVVTLSNVGDAAAGETTLDVQVDGKSIGTKTYSEILAGGGAKEVFPWTAVRGTHTITARVGDQTWTKEITVQKAPEVKATTDYAAMMWPTLLVIVMVGLVAFGALSLRRK